MSGIAVIVDFTGKPVSEGAIARVTGAMPSRGPDGVRHWREGSVALGHCAMHATPGSADAPQPLANENPSCVLAMDGYIANHEELRRDLAGRGAVLRGSSDAELVLAAYETWGEACPERIAGEYAFALWDARKGRLYAARDHQGLRPLFYHWTGERLVMASDIAGVLAAVDGEPEYDDEFLAQMAAHEWFTRDGTLWRGVRRVPPAHWMAFSRGRVREGQHWHLPPPLSIRYKRDEDYAEHHREVLDTAVRQASRAAGPIGLETSGGLDSSALFAVADRIGLNDIRGYAFAGPQGTRADETEYVRALGEHLGRDISLHPLFIPDLDWFIARARADRDMAYFPNGAMTFDLYRAMASDGVRVAINGLGGDEWLGGNASHYAESLGALDWRQFACSFKADADRVGVPKTSRMVVRYGLKPLLKQWLASGPAARARSTAMGLDAIEWLSDRAREILADGLATRERKIAGARGSEKAERMFNYPLNSILLDHASRLRSLAGIEGRSPLLSREVIAFSAATPQAIRLRGGVTKFIHRKALEGLLPQSILRRTTKAEFGVSYDSQIDAVRRVLSYRPSTGAEWTLSIPPDRLSSPETFDRQVDGRIRWSVWNLLSLSALSEEKFRRTVQ